MFMLLMTGVHLELQLPLDNLINDSGGVFCQNIPRLVYKISSCVSQEYEVRVQVDKIGTRIVPLSTLCEVLKIKTCMCLRCHRHLDREEVKRINLISTDFVFHFEE